MWGNLLARMKILRTGVPGVDLQTAYFVPTYYGRLSR